VLKVAAYVLLVLAIGAALTLWRASAREAAAEAAYPPEGRIIEVNGHPVHVAERGLAPGAGPDLVLIHGAFASTRDFTFALTGKLEDRYRIIVLDRPGFGYTPPLHSRGESLKEQADLLQAAAAQLGADTPIVAGQSYGGAVAIAWAIHHPEHLSALVSIAGGANPWNTPTDALYRLTGTPFGSRFVVPLITAWVPEWYVQSGLDAVFTPQAVPEGYSEYFGVEMSLRRASFAANARQRLQIKAEIDAQHLRNSEISVPTEIVHGTADTTVAMEIHSVPLTSQVEGAILTPLPGIGHAPQHVARDEVAAAIDRAATRAGLR